jgi:tetratricopeptide (TPR) repeat protein
MAYYGRGRSLEKQNMRSKAVQDYRKALEHDPNHRSARKALERLGVDP